MKDNLSFPFRHLHPYKALSSGLILTLLALICFPANAQDILQPRPPGLSGERSPQGLYNTVQTSDREQEVQKRKKALRSWLPLLFGEDDEQGPEDTLVAPFADNIEQKMEENERQPPQLGEKEAPLNEPHIPYREVQAWVIRRISEGMNFENTNFPDVLSKLRPHMSADAVQGYVNFLGSEGIYKQAVTGPKVINSIITSQPVLSYYDESCPELISEFIQSDRYHWRFDVDLIYSLLDKDIENYSKANSNAGQQTLIRVLVAREDKERAPDGLIILEWGYGRACS